MNGHRLYRKSSWHGVCSCGIDVYGRLGDELSLRRAYRLHLWHATNPDPASLPPQDRHPAGKGRDVNHPAYGQGIPRTDLDYVMQAVRQLTREPAGGPA